MATKTKATKKTADRVPDTEAVVAVGEVSLSLPVGDIPDGVYLSNHYNVTAATRKQRRGMRRLVEGAQQQRLRLENGKTVDTPIDVLRWFLEQVEDAAA
jgi:hypothetical protein